MRTSRNNVPWAAIQPNLKSRSKFYSSSQSDFLGGAADATPDVDGIPNAETATKTALPGVARENSPTLGN